MEFNVRKSIIAVTALGGVVFANNMIFKRSPVEVVENDEEVVVKKSSKRSPASYKNSFRFNEQRPQSSAYDPQVTSSRSNGENFSQNTDAPEGTSEGEAQGAIAPGNSISDASSNSNSTSYRAPSYSPSSSPSSSSNSKSATTTTGATSGIGGLSGGGYFSGVPLPNRPGTTGSTTPTSGTTTPTGNTSSTPVADVFSCASNVGGGAFGNPIQVTLTCTTSSTIKYCLQENTCCDPETAGVAYTTPVVMGGKSGTYCLSFYGETSSMTTSTVTQASYVFNNTYPDLQISHPKIVYQTTQLPGLNYLQSTDFSKSNYLIGEINLKNHDPSPSGLNMDCQEIVEESASLTPAPVQVFTPIDMATLVLGNQLNIPLALTRLIYGDNFITSYAVNNNFAAPLYSCSTNKVVLNDFEYFASEASHGEIGTNTVREFSGSFVSYSFFESDTDLNRLPAGSANQNDAGQELRTGSFGVFY